MNGATKAHNNQIKAIAEIESLNPTNKNKRTKCTFFLSFWQRRHNNANTFPNIWEPNNGNNKGFKAD